MKNNASETYIVKGMSCKGCEAVIEKILMRQEGVKEAKASFSKNLLTVVYDEGSVNFENIRAALKRADYIIEKGPLKEASKNTDSQETFSAVQLIGMVVILMALYLMIKNTVGFNFIPEVTPSMGYGVLFVVGLLTSLHCVAMCGGINMSQCVPRGSAETDGEEAKIKPSLLYNLGRVVSYTIIGGIIGALGSVISFTGWARGMVAIVSGIFMVIMGISMLGIFPWMNKITPRIPWAFRKKGGVTGRGNGPFIVGLFNGLMPCGPLQAMQIYALGTGSFIVGALSMFFFSLGTLPLMFGFGAIVSLLGGRFTKKMMKLSAVLVAVLGIIMLNRGLALSGMSFPIITAAPPSIADGSLTSKVNVENGEQTVTSTLTSSGYPSITVQEGVPVSWNLQADSSNINGCNRTFVIPEYDLQIKLKAGDNMIKFTPTESGTFTYSCWMGMQTGQITVVDDLGSQTAQTASNESTTSAGSPSGGQSCCAE